MMRRSVVVSGLVLVGAMLGGGVMSHAMQDGQPQNLPSARPSADMGQMLINGLKNSPGCLGVDAGNMSSGKNCIIAWFENKAAAKAWYYSPVHRGFMMAVGGNANDQEPMQHITDEEMPIMVMASITASEDAGAGKPPFSQISIELYAPLPGGAHVNGRLAPETFVVPHMKALGE